MDLIEAKIGTCSFCESKNVLLTETKVRWPKEEVWNLCEICRNNLATGQAIDHPNNYTVHELDMVKMIAWIGNRILEEVKKEK